MRPWPRHRYLTNALRIALSVAAVLCMAAVPAPANEALVGTITISSPWSRATPKGATELCTARRRLDHKHREAHLLIAASGLSSPEAASLCGWPAEMLKGRVNRVRTAIAGMLAIDVRPAAKPIPPSAPLWRAGIARGGLLDGTVE